MNQADDDARVSNEQESESSPQHDDAFLNPSDDETTSDDVMSPDYGVTDFPPWHVGIKLSGSGEEEEEVTKVQLSDDSEDWVTSGQVSSSDDGGESSPDVGMDDMFDYYNELFSRDDDSSDSDVDSDDLIGNREPPPKIEVVFSEHESMKNLVSALSKNGNGRKAKSVTFRNPIAEVKDTEEEEDENGEERGSPLEDSPEFQAVDLGGETNNLRKENELTPSLDYRELETVSNETGDKTNDHKTGESVGVVFQLPNETPQLPKPPVTETEHLLEQSGSDHSEDQPSDEFSDFSLPASSRIRLSPKLKRTLKDHEQSEGVTNMIKSSKKKKRPSVQEYFSDLPPNLALQDADGRSENLSGQMSQPANSTHESAECTGDAGKSVDNLRNAFASANDNDIHDVINGYDVTKMNTDAATAPNEVFVAHEETKDNVNSKPEFSSEATKTTSSASPINQIFDCDAIDEVFSGFEECESISDRSDDLLCALSDVSNDDVTVGGQKGDDVTVQAGDEATVTKGSKRKPAGKEEESPFRRLVMRVLQTVICCYVSPSSYFI